MAEVRNGVLVSDVLLGGLFRGKVKKEEEEEAEEEETVSLLLPMKLERGLANTYLPFRQSSWLGDKRTILRDVNILTSKFHVHRRRHT